MTYFSKFVLFLFLSLTCFAQESSPYLRDNTASYLDKVSQRIATEFVLSPHSGTIKNSRLEILSSPDNIKIISLLNKHLLYAMTQEGFHVSNAKIRHSLGLKSSSPSRFVLLSDTITYKHETILNFMIIQRKTGDVLAIARVAIPRRIILKVDHLLSQDSWFRETKQIQSKR
jgi:hypothetical protein